MKIKPIILIFFILASIYTLELCQSQMQTCLPCPRQCSSCSNQDQCQTCNTQFFYLSNSNTLRCQACPQNCLVCINSQICTNCRNPYVLVNSTCSLCSILRAVSCSSTISATLCQKGYYLIDNYCKSCLLNCISCTSAYDCSACSSGFYLNSTIITCNPCRKGCSSCSQFSSDQCLSCNDGYGLSNNVCQPVSCNITNCMYCLSVSICKRCNYLYYWNGSSCIMGGSVLCQSGAKGSLPIDCINSCSNYTYAVNQSSTNFQCKIHSSIYIYPTEYRQYYYYSYNHLQFLKLISNSNNNLILQNNGQYSYQINKLTFSQLQNYYRLQIAIKYTSINNLLLNLTATTPSSVIQFQNHLIEASSSPRGKLISSSVVHSNNLLFQSNGSLNVIELWLRLWKCSSGCIVCLNQQLCQLCNEPMFMLGYNCVVNCNDFIHFEPNRTCLTSCPNNYYQILQSNLKYCQPCKSPCLNCANDTFCLSCTSGFYYHNFKCLSLCPDDYYPNNATSSCKSCISPCKKCINGQQCLSCSQGFWNGSHCINYCLPGQYGDLSNNICASCSIQCLTCVNISTRCTSCKSNLIFYRQQCLSNCPERFYNESGICSQCLPPCYACLGINICLSCSSNYLLNTSCLSNCPISFYQDIANAKCLSCLSQCKSCNSGNSCLSCNFGCLFNGKCSQNCTNQQFYKEINSKSECTCTRCLYPCNTCQSSSICLSCVDGYLFNNLCLIQCPVNYYANTKDGICSLCNLTFSNCLNCISSSCTLCANNYLLLNGKCLVNCPQFYYKQNSDCILCIAPCKTCNSNQKCTSCIFPYSLSGSSCLIACPTNSISLSENSNLVCKICNSPCQSCSIVQSNCTYCIFGYYLFDYKCHTNCSAIYQPFLYYNQLSTLTCDPCLFPCQKCLSQTQCVSCKIGYLNNITQTCSQCIIGTYSFNNICQLCHNSCEICFSDKFCTSCKSGYYLYNNFCINNASICYDNGFYVSGKVCYPCFQPCKTCFASSNNCTSCLAGYIFSSPNACVISCPNGFYKQGTICETCSQQCATCISNSQYCLSCSTNYVLYLTNASCLISCPQYTYLMNKVCSACQYPCATCKSQSSCLSCVSGVIVGQQCYSSCLTGYFANSSMMCQACISPCSQCANSSTLCTQCISNYWLLNNTCRISCPTGTFSQSQSKNCLNCVGLCKECNSYINCTQCISNYIFFYNFPNSIGQCILQCPAGYYLSNNSCILCKYQCQTCVDNSTCTLCKNNKFQYNGSCLDICPSKKYSLGGICEDCQFPCLQCTDAYTCTSCPLNFLLVGSSSCIPGPNCPSGYYLSVSQPRCDSKCAPGFYNLNNGTCNPVSCALQQFMGDDMFCYSICPSGFRGNQTYHCNSCNPCNFGLYYSLEYKIIRDEFYLYIYFTQTPVYKFSPKLLFNPSFTFESINSPQGLVGNPLNYSGQTNITLKILFNSSISQITLNSSFMNPLTTFLNPLQKSHSSLKIEGYDLYPPNLNNMSFFGIFALVCAFLGLFKNPLMTDFAQNLFLIGLLDIHYPKNLASFLESTSIAHLHGLISLIIQQNNVGRGKFMYLTGTGFLSNTFTNIIFIMSFLFISLLLYIWLLFLEYRSNYNKIQNQNENNETMILQQSKPEEKGKLITYLQKFCTKFKTNWLNRLIYFNYSIISLFSMIQLTNPDMKNPINFISCALSIIILPCLLVFPLLMKKQKPKYTFLYARKLLISGAVVLSIQDAIYAVGIISVCNIATVILMLVYKVQRYRIQTRLLAIGQLLQLFTFVCISLFVMIGQGNRTQQKVIISWIILFCIIAILFFYIIETLAQLFIYFYNRIKQTQLRQNWILNIKQQSQESHHSQSNQQSVKQINKDKDRQQKSENKLQAVMIQIKPQQQHSLQNKISNNKSRVNNQIKRQFWAYQASDDQVSQEPKFENNIQVLPELLVRCVNEFSDYDLQSNKKQ